MPSPFVYKDLQFPLGGLNRKYALQNQPPYTTPDAVNVRPETLPDRRCRGGSRAGVNKYIDTILSGKINILAFVRGARYEFIPGDQYSTVETTTMQGVDGSYQVAFIDDFEGTALNENIWEAFGTLGMPKVDKNPPNEKYIETCGALRKKFAYDTAKPYTFKMYISRLLNQSNYGEYSICAGMNNNSPTTESGVMAKAVVGEEGTYIETYLDGELVDTSDTLTAEYGVLQIRNSSTGSIEVSFDGQSIHTINNAQSATGSRFGFILSCTNETGGVAPIDWVEFDYYADVEDYPPVDGEGEYNIRGALILEKNANILVAGANGYIYRESPKGMLNCVNTNGIKTEQKNYPVLAVSRLHEMFVADHRSNLEGKGMHKAIGTDGAITSGVLSATSVSDWTALGITANSDVVTLSDASTNVAVGTYKVSAVAAAGITLQGYSGGDGTTTYAVDVSPKVLDSDAGTYIPWMATTGSVPCNCPLIAIYRDRIVLAGAEDNPHLWYMSRQGNPYDWNYTEDMSTTGTDYGIAVAGQNSDAGTIGKPIRALIPHSDDYLLFGYDNELWILRGDPAASGQIDCISREVGVIGKRAWCYGEKSEVYFLSQNGIYMLGSGYSTPQQISRTKIPNELLNRNFRENVMMVYDHDWHGCHLLLEGENKHWFFDLDSFGIWQIQFANGMAPSSMLRIDGNTLIGCSDGYIRKYDGNSRTDDGVCFDSSVLIGPIVPTSNNYTASIMQKLCCTFDGSAKSRGLSINIYVGDEPVSAWENYRSGEITETITLSKPISTQLKRIRAGAVILELKQSGLAEWWGMERIGMYAKRAGNIKE